MARNPHPEVTERRILAAAKSCRRERLRQDLHPDIIDKLGDLSRGAIYHHFKSKEAILERLNTDDWHASQALCDEIAKTRRHERDGKAPLAVRQLAGRRRAPGARQGHRAVLRRSRHIHRQHAILVNRAAEKLRAIDRGRPAGRLHPHRIPARSGAAAGPAMQLLADAMLLPRHAHAAAVSSAMPRHRARRAARAGLRPASHRSRHGRHDGLRRRRQRQRRRANKTEAAPVR